MLAQSKKISEYFKTPHEMITFLFLLPTVIMSKKLLNSK